MNLNIVSESGCLLSITVQELQGRDFDEYSLWVFPILLCSEVVEISSHSYKQIWKKEVLSLVTNIKVFGIVATTIESEKILFFHIFHNVLLGFWKPTDSHDIAILGEVWCPLVDIDILTYEQLPGCLRCL
jgi:hypothetical protein